MVEGGIYFILFHVLMFVEWGIQTVKFQCLKTSEEGGTKLSLEIWKQFMNGIESKFSYR